MANSNNNTNTWNINTDVYDIVDSINNLKKTYIEDEDETTLSLGVFGFITDTEAKKIQTATIMAGQLGNEMFPTRARLTKNILTHAAYTGITDFNAIASRITTTICIKTADIDKYIVDDGTTNSNGYFYLDALTPIFIEDYEFHLDFDVRIRRRLVRDENGAYVYNYQAQYIVVDEETGRDIINPISDLTDPYIRQPFLINIGNEEYLGIQCTLRQCSIEEITDTIVSDSIIENKTYSFDFDNQLAGFTVVVTDNGRTYELTPYMYGTVEEPQVEYYCWYIYTGENRIRVTFDSASFIPGLNAQVYIKVYNTLGKAGNFEYLTIDQTSEGLYVDLDSDNRKYKNMTVYIVAVTDSTDGSDRKTKEELQKLIPKAAMARGALTTDTDVNNYFNLINTDTNRMVMQKKEDNQLNRIWYGYFLLKDDNGNIIPTNTVNIQVDIEDPATIVTSDDGRIIIPAGTHFRYDSVDNIAYIVDESAIPSLYTDDYFNNGYYYYMNFYNIVICKDPLYAAYYLTTCDYDSFFTYDYVNQNSDVQFIANRFHVRRNLLIDKASYFIDFNIAQSVNDNSFHFIDITTHTWTDTSGSTTTETITSDNGKVILVLYKDNIPYRWMECVYIDEESEPDQAIFHFRAIINSDSAFDEYNCINVRADDTLYHLNEAGSRNSLYGYVPENCEARIYILAHINHDVTVEYPRNDLDNIAPGYEDYTVTNIYKCINGINFFTNLTDKTNTRIDHAEGESKSTYNIKGVPMIGKHYLESEEEVSFVGEAIREKNAYIDYCMTLLDNGMTVDFKFFNTYGVARTYTCENGTPIGHIDCTFEFKLSLKDNTDSSIVSTIREDVKTYIENINNIVDFHAPNLVTEITDKYNDKINFFEFVQFNEFGTGNEHIICSEEVDDPTIVPEFINVRNYKDHETTQLVPRIEIRLV